jgi:hypothetical protein
MMNTLAIAVAAVLFASGLYVRFSQSWSGLYQANIIFHPAFGLAATLWLIVFYIEHAREHTGDAPVRRGAGSRALVAGTLALGALCAYWPRPFLALACVLCAFGFWFTTRRMLAGRLAGAVKIAAAGWQLVYFLLLLNLFTGMALLPMQNVARSGYLFLLHEWAGYAAVAAFAFSLAVPFAARASEPGGVRRYWTAARAAIVVSAFFAAGLFALVSLEDQVPGPVYNASLSTIPIEKRAPEDKFPAPLPADVAEMAQMSQSCAENPGCHQQEMEDFLISNHNLSVRTPYFQKNLRMLKEEIGEENLLICAGCHYPYMMLSGNLDYEYYKTNNGFSCVYCHQIGSVRKHASDKRITYLTVEPHVAHLKMFYNADGNPRISKWNELLVKLNPTGHGRVFTRPLYFKDEYCQVCHELQIKTPKFAGLQRNTCIRCHMQPRRLLGFEGAKMNHYFPGTNTAVPHTLGLHEVVDMVQAWVRGDIDSSAPDAKFWTLRKSSGERSERAVWLFMNIEPQSAPRPGERFSFNVITTNTGIDHQFPSAPLDLVEAWLHVRVLDATGSTVYELGALDENFRLAPDYPEQHRLGGYMLDSQNHLLIQNRVWDIQKKIILRNIMPYESVKDRIEFTLPENARGPLRVTASWMYRKLNQDFVDWGLEDTDMGDLPKTAPATVVGDVTATLKMDSGKTPHAMPGGN